MTSPQTRGGRGAGPSDTPRRVPGLENNMSEFVERPASSASASRYLPTAQLLETATNGQAVRVPLNGRTRVLIASASESAARYHGYRSHSRSDGDHVILWWEKR